MKKLTSLLIGCSLALAGAALAQQPDEQASPGKKQGGDKKHAADAKAGAAAEKPAAAAAKPAAAPIKPAANAANPAPAAHEAKPQGAPAKQPGAMNAPAAAKAHEPAAPAPKPAASASAASSASTQPAASMAPAAKGDAQQHGKGAKAAPANAKASPTATASASVAPSAKPSVAASPSATPVASASASAAPSATATASAATSPNQPNAQVKPGVPAKKPDPQQVQQIKKQHENFRAQARPQQVPTVTFQQNYQIQGSDRWQGPQYEVYRSYRPERHDQGYYQSRYSRVELIGGGYYYYNNGYWAPAWGYSPQAEYYAYDAPIYVGQHADPPDKVIANVQATLQQMGYYKGEVDGLLGPLTREALTSYQANQGLTATAVIDQPTLDSLGMG